MTRLGIGIGSYHRVVTGTLVADFTAGTLPASMGFARSGSGYSVRTGTGVVATSGSFTSSDQPRFGRALDADPLRLVIEETRTQLLVRSDVADASWHDYNGCTTSAHVASPLAPDGTQTANDTATPGAGAKLLFYVPTMTNGATYTASIYARRKTVGDSHQLAVVNGGLNAGRALGTTLLATWLRPQVSLVAGTDTAGDLTTCFLAATLGSAGNGATSIFGGVAAGTRGGYLWESQFELGAFATEVMPATGSTVTRAGERAWVLAGVAAAGAFVAGGRHRFYAKLQAKGSSAGYGADFYLWYVDASNHVRFLGGAAPQLVVTIGGLAYTAAATPVWSIEDTLEVWVEAGAGGATRAVMRVNAGSAYLLSLGGATSQSAVAAITGTMDVFCKGTTNQFSCRAETISNVQPTWAAFNTTPDWRTALEGWNDTARAPIVAAGGGYITPHGFASVDVMTDAANANVAFWTDNSAPQFEAAIEVQDVASNTWVRVAATTNNALNSIAAALPGSGLRRLRLYPGILRGALGTWLARIVSHDGTVCTVLPAATAPATRLVILGDSIPEQLTTGVVARDNVLGVLRASLSNTRVTYIGAGGDSLAGHYLALPALMREVSGALADVASGGTKIVYVQWGYNDYNAAWGSSAAYLTQLTNLLVALRAAAPTARVVLQTLGTTTNTTSGNGLGDAGWRSAQTSTFNAWSDGNKQLVVGPTLYALTDLADGVHHTPAGAAVDAAGIKAALGIT